MTVLAGGSRCNSKYFAWHLQRTDKGQTVEIAEAVGLIGQDMKDWFLQMEAMSLGGRTTNFFYHLSVSPREGETFTPEQEKIAVATALENLGLEDQPYFVVKHGGKDGRADHYHVVALRVDLDTGKAISDSNNYAVHMKTADQLEEIFSHARTERGRGPNGPNPKNWEVQRGKDTGIKPKDVGQEVTALWQQTDSPQSFAAALEEHGYILAEGDRGLCIVDPAAKEHSLARRIDGARKKDIDARFAGFDRSALPTVEDARAQMRARKAERRQARREEKPEPLPVSRQSAPSVEAPAPAKPRQRSRVGAFLEDLAHGIKNAFSRKEVPQLTMGERAPVEASAFDRVAESLTRGAKESAPIAAELAVGAAVLEGEHLLTAEKEAAYTRRDAEPSPEPEPPAPSRFDRIARELAAQAPAHDAFAQLVEESKRAHRDAGGEGLFIAEGLDWLAQKVRHPSTATAPPDPDDAFAHAARALADATRENGGETVTADGTSFWQRGVDLLRGLLERSTSWIKERLGTFTERLMQERQPEHEPEHDR